MPASVEQNDISFLIRLEGEIGLADSSELKRFLLEGLASGRKLRLDLEHAGQIDVTFLQLWQAALLEGARGGQAIELCMSEAVATALREAGFATGADGPAGSS